MRVRYRFNRPHVLAPNSIDLVKYGQKGNRILFRSQDSDHSWWFALSKFGYLGQNIGQRIGVEIPPRYYFLLQVGEQLEHITGGLITAGFHEVVVNDQTLAVTDPDVNIFLCSHRRVSAFLISY